MEYPIGIIHQNINLHNNFYCESKRTDGECACLA